MALVVLEITNASSDSIPPGIVSSLNALKPIPDSNNKQITRGPSTLLLFGGVNELKILLLLPSIVFGGI